MTTKENSSIPSGTLLLLMNPAMKLGGFEAVGEFPAQQEDRLDRHQLPFIWETNYVPGMLKWLAAHETGRVFSLEYRP